MFLAREGNYLSRLFDVIRVANIEQNHLTYLPLCNMLCKYVRCTSNVGDMHAAMEIYEVDKHCWLLTTEERSASLSML